MSVELNNQRACTLSLTTSTLSLTASALTVQLLIGLTNKVNELSVKLDKSDKQVSELTVLVNKLSIKDNITSPSTVQDDFNYIQEKCKDVLYGSTFDVNLSPNYVVDGNVTEEYKLLHKMCRDKNWYIFSTKNGFKVVIFKAGETMNTLVHNLKLSVDVYEGGNVRDLIISIPYDIDYQDLKLISTKYSIRITYIKRCEELKETTFNIQKINCK